MTEDVVIVGLDYSGPPNIEMFRVEPGKRLVFRRCRSTDPVYVPNGSIIEDTCRNIYRADN